MRVFEYALDSAASMGADHTSPAQALQQMQIASVQAVWTGSPVGTLSLLISNDGVTYSTYTGSSTAVSGAGDFVWNLASLGFNYVKVKYTRASGTGSLNITVSGKGP